MVGFEWKIIRKQQQHGFAYQVHAHQIRPFSSGILENLKTKYYRNAGAVERAFMLV
jgi:hypothetical protein